MLQVDELDVPPKSPDTEHENLSLVDIQQLIKQEKCEAEELPSDDDLHKLTDEQFAKKSEASSSKSKKAGNVKRVRVQKPSKVGKKKEIQPSTQYERLSNRELLAEMIKNEILETDVRPVHTCKFCHRNFSSAFILCLHIQIHEKVNSVSKMFEQNKSAAVDSTAPTVIQTENKGRDVHTFPTISTIGKSVTIGKDVTMTLVNSFPTVSPIETQKKADTLPAVSKIVNIQAKKVNSSSPISKVTNIEAKNAKTAGCGSSGVHSRPKIKTETFDECDISIKTEQVEPVSFVKNNFVENLKKNLSLAMNRKL